MSLFRRALVGRLSSSTAPPTLSIGSFESAVRRLIESRQFSNIEPLAETYKKTAPSIAGDRLLASVIFAYGRARMADRAIEAFDHLDCPRSLLAFNTLLTACNVSRAFDKVPRLFTELPGKYGLVPNVVSYGVLIKAHCERGSPESARQVLDEMKDRDLSANIIILTSVLDGFYKKGMVEEAERVWSEMGKIGDGPDVTAYNVRVMHAHGGKPGEVMRLINEMLFMGMKPDVTSYNYLMTCLCKHGMMEDAKKVYGTMLGDVCWANDTTYRVFLFYMCRSGDFDMGLEVFKMSLKRNKMPDFETVKLLVVGLVSREKMKEAKEVIALSKNKSQENKLRPWWKLEAELGLKKVKVDAPIMARCKNDF